MDAIQRYNTWAQALRDAEARFDSGESNGDWEEIREAMSEKLIAAESILGITHTSPRVHIVHMRDPDSACDVQVYVDGVKVDADVWDFDPGAGYTEEQIDDMKASIQDAPEFLKPVLEPAYKDMEPTFERWSL